MPRSPARRWKWHVVVAVLVMSLAAGAVVFAKWSASATGGGRASAQTMNSGNQPSAVVTASSVAVSWSASALAPGGQAVGGYIVRRYDSLGAAQTIGAACNVTVAALTCTEANVPNGNWQYSVTPALSNWRGPESAKRAVTVSVPTVTATSPNFAYRTTTQNIAVTGTGFVSGAAVTFPGTGITTNSTTFVSATQLTANVTIGSTATQGARNVTVTNPSGLGASTCTGCFTVPSGPTVSSATPSSLAQGATAQNLTVAGNFFVSGAAVTFSGTGITVISTTFVSATQLTANVTVATAATVGARNVTVTNPSTFGNGTCTGCFSVTAMPGTFTLNPNTRGQGAANQNIVITGSAFVSGATVAFSGTGITVNSTTFNSATQLTVNVTVAASATVGARNVTVTNPDAGTRTVNNAFTVVVGPVPTSVTPNSRARNTTTSNTITGTGFVTGAVATFSGAGITVNSTTFVSATQLTVSITIAAAAATGVRDVTVTNPNAGTATCLSCFSVT